VHRLCGPGALDLGNDHLGFAGVGFLAYLTNQAPVAFLSVKLKVSVMGGACWLTSQIATNPLAVWLRPAGWNHSALDQLITPSGRSWVEFEYGRCLSCRPCGSG
jgi:hypothetical protein